MYRKPFSLKLFLWVIGICYMWPLNVYSLNSVTLKGGGMLREVHLGMTKHELITTVGAPERAKTDGSCLHYDTFDASIFLDSNLQVDRIYLGKNFQGTVKKLDGSDAPLRNIFSEFGNPQTTERLAYAPSSSIQNRSTVELEYEIVELQTDKTTFPLEYRGNRKLYEFYGHGLVMKYKYVLDEDGIAFYLDQNKMLYATVIYPPLQKPAPKPCEEVIAFEMIHFDFDKYNIKEKYIPILDHYVNYLNKNDKVYVTIEGHTDAKGTNAYNQRLSEKRAHAVYNYFINKGIAASRLNIVGRGKSLPIASNSTPQGQDNPEGRAINRRVQFQLRRQTP